MSLDILAVDDNAANLQSLEAVLGDLGARIVTARSGDEALRHILAQDFALILLDVQMPKMDGYELARLVRARERSRHVPIIFLTAFNREETQVRRGYAMGAVDFLFKPVDPDALRAKVGFFLEYQAKTRQAEEQSERLRQAEKRAHELSLEEARNRFEQAWLKREAERERRAAEAESARAEELTLLVDQLEIARKALTRSNGRLELLAEGARELLQRESPAGLIPEILPRFGAQLGLECQLHFTFDPASQRFTRVFANAPAVAAPVLDATVSLPLSDALLQALVDERQTKTVSAEELTTSTLGALGFQSALLVPLATQRELLGLIVLGSAGLPDLSDGVVSLLQLWSTQVCAATERARLIDELKDADRRKNEFLAMLGHELRNPLVPIRNAIEILRKSKASAEPVLQRALSASERQVNHIGRLLDDLLDVARITQGRIELQRRTVTLHSLLEQAIEATETAIRNRRHTFDLALEEGNSLLLDADPTRMVQVFANLLHNAAKYTEPGGHIALRVEQKGDAVRVRIRDSGIGIRPDMLGRVFDIFVQEEPSSDRAQGGLGLGLFLVRSVVMMHGGSVTALSEGLGKGCEFVVELPIVQANDAVRAAMAEAASSDAPIDPLTILLVDDNADIRTTMRDYLELYGHFVEEAADGINAIRVARERRPEVALIDIGLPGMDGYSVAANIRAAAECSGTRLVAITGYGGNEARARALSSGFDEHLVKPVDLSSFWNVIRRLRSSADTSSLPSSTIDSKEPKHANASR